MPWTKRADAEDETRLSRPPAPGSQVLASPNIKLFNATAAEDLIVREDTTGEVVGGGK